MIFFEAILIASKYEIIINKASVIFVEENYILQEYSFILFHCIHREKNQSKLTCTAY